MIIKRFVVFAFLFIGYWNATEKLIGADGEKDPVLVVSPAREKRPRSTHSTPVRAADGDVKTSPWKEKVTPNRSTVHVSTDRAELAKRKAETLSLGIGSVRRILGGADHASSIAAAVGDPSAAPAFPLPPLIPRVSSLTRNIEIPADIQEALLADCRKHRKEFAAFCDSLEKTIATEISAGTAEGLEVFNLHPFEEAFWQNKLISLLFRVPARMPYRVKLRVKTDRENALPVSPAFNGKNKKAVFEHALSYDQFCTVFLSGGTRVYRIDLYPSDLRTEDEMRAGAPENIVLHSVIEFHYPVRLGFEASASSTVGEAGTSVDLGPREAVITFKEARESLRARIAAGEAVRTIKIPDTKAGGEKEYPVLEGARYNQLYHACFHGKPKLDGRIPTRVHGTITPDYTGRPCLEFIEIPS